VSSREVIQRLHAAGWFVARVSGSYHQLRHPTRPGTVTVPHPKKDLPRGTLKSIERQSGVKLSE
jgi:predicted RNA binding protein YcfA (HicA-like mRNA interferase family)